MGWGITRGRPPDEKQQEETKRESKNELVKTIKWKEQLEENNLGTEPLLFNGDGKYGRKRSRDSGRDKQAGTGDDKGPLSSQIST